MKYVYILESLDFKHFYVGITDDLRARLAKHNAVRSRTLRNTDRGE
jgi:predicted GIY-YIG superfamily endonuclease